jgi:hypothetical protein
LEHTPQITQLPNYSITHSLAKPIAKFLAKEKYARPKDQAGNRVHFYPQSVD